MQNDVYTGRIKANTLNSLLYISARKILVFLIISGKI